MVMTTVKANGIRLHYNIEGEGPPLLLISGLGGHSGAWATVKPLLTKHYRVITFDNRGTGQSDAPAGPYTIDQMADDAAALLTELRVGPVAVVGWSLGGSVLQSLLIRHGALIQRAVLLSAFPSYTGLQHGWLDCLLELKRSEIAPASLAMFSMAWGFTPRILYNHGAVEDGVRLATEEDRWPTSAAGLVAQAHGLRRYDSRADLPKVSAPVLVLVGAEDILTPPAQSAEMAALIPNAKLQILPRGGHGMILEYTPDTVAAITAFLGQGR
jgi:pimeloyl-ACP methyl ester carboxylesterase